MRQIYLDYNATTPLAPEVQEAMLPFLAQAYGNPSSGHSLGREAREAVDDARSRVASLIGCASDEIVFTSGGTESNNLALKGVAFRNGKGVEDSQLVTSAIEHPAITEPARFLERQGFEIAIVGTDSQGIVDLETVQQTIGERTFLVSVMHANNEVGTIQSVAEIAAHCRERNVLVHTDAAQSIGKIPVDVTELGVDLLSIAGHKLYAPKGVGALYVRRGTMLEPLLHGAPQEQGLRAGTENTAQIVGLGVAAESAQRHLKAIGPRYTALRDRLLTRMRNGIDERLHVHGEEAERLPNTLLVNFPQVTASDLLGRVPELCASIGAACHSHEVRLSDTLSAMGVGADKARGTIRLSVGRFTTEDEVDRAADLLVEAWTSLKR